MIVGASGADGLVGALGKRMAKCEALGALERGWFWGVRRLAGVNVAEK